MKPTTIAAIYFLFWFISLFLVLPFGVRTTEEEGGELVPGQAESAPHHFNVWRMILRTTLLSGAFFAIFYLNYMFGWITPQSFHGIIGTPDHLLK